MVFSRFDSRSTFIFEPKENFLGDFIITVKITDTNAYPKSREYKLRVNVALLVIDPELSEEEKDLLGSNIKGYLKAKISRVS